MVLEITVLENDGTKVLPTNKKQFHEKYVYDVIRWLHVKENIRLFIIDVFSF